MLTSLSKYESLETSELDNEPFELAKFSPKKSKSPHKNTGNVQHTQNLSEYVNAEMSDLTKGNIERVGCEKVLDAQHVDNKRTRVASVSEEKQSEFMEIISKSKQKSDPKSMETPEWINAGDPKGRESKVQINAGESKRTESPVQKNAGAQNRPHSAEGGHVASELGSKGSKKKTKKGDDGKHGEYFAL